MNPSSEVEKASGEEMEMGEMMEDVVTMVDAMTSAVEAVEAMVLAVEMREWLEMGRTETERTTAVHFFSRALVVQKQKVLKWSWPWYCSYRRYIRPLYWPGPLPDLLQLLADCLRPHNSKAIQSGAMQSIKHLTLSSLGTNWDHHPRKRTQYSQCLREVHSHASDHLLRLVRETDCTEIRDQATWLLGRMAGPIGPMGKKDFMPLLIVLVRHYAAILEPTDAEISCLNTAIKALTQAHKTLYAFPFLEQPSGEVLQIFPVLIRIFQEPGKRKKAQVRVGDFLGTMARILEGNFFLENGTTEMLLETVREGKEPTAVLVMALQALGSIIVNANGEHAGKLLDMGPGVFHLVLKRPNGRFKHNTLWASAMQCLRNTTERFATEMGADLSQEGLVELVLDRAMGMDMTEETALHHHWTIVMLALDVVTKRCSESQMRELMLKDPLFHLFSRYFNHHQYLRRYLLCRAVLCILDSVKACLEKCSAANQPILRRLLDSTGITDAVRRISLDVPENHYRQDEINLARNILDTYLNNPLPPLPTHKLPSIIYTRNALS